MTEAHETNTPVVVVEESHTFIGEWLPSWAQMKNAFKLRFDTPPDPEDSEPIIESDSVLYASMRQGMGMIIVAGLAAGLPSFIWNWLSAGRDGTVVPLSELSRATLTAPTEYIMGGSSAFTDLLQQIAGLEPSVFPGWLAAGVSSFGLWLNVPLQWLTVWIVYGLLVLLVAKMMGATTTLQQFYTVTSFGFLPLVLTALAPVPCLGAIVSMAGLIWAIAVYTVGVRTVTRLSTGMSLLCTILPGVTLLLIGAAVAIAVAATTVDVLM